MQGTNIATLHIVVLSLVSLVVAITTEQWAVAAVPACVAMDMLVLYRSCPIRTEVIFVCLGIAWLALLYNLLPLMFLDFQPGSESVP